MNLMQTFPTNPTDEKCTQRVRETQDTHCATLSELPPLICGLLCQCIKVSYLSKAEFQVGLEVTIIFF